MLFAAFMEWRTQRLAYRCYYHLISAKLTQYVCYILAYVAYRCVYSPYKNVRFKSHVLASGVHPWNFFNHARGSKIILPAQQIAQ